MCIGFRYEESQAERVSLRGDVVTLLSSRSPLTGVLGRVCATLAALAHFTADRPRAARPARPKPASPRLCAVERLADELSIERGHDRETLHVLMFDRRTQAPAPMVGVSARP